MGSKAIFDPALIESLIAQIERIYSAAEQPIPEAATTALAIPDQGLGSTALPQLWDQIVDGSSKLASPWMIGHMDTAPHPAAALTDALVSALNNNLLFRELSPLASQLEEVLIAEFAKRLGLSPNSEGIFCSGGSLANLTALFAACGGYAGGVEREQVLLAVPEGVHASFSKAAAVLGITARNQLQIPCDSAGRMEVDALRQTLDESQHDTKIVVAVLGGTVTGSVDDLPAIAAVCERAGAWLHVDAIYGGALAYSKRYRNFLQGLSAAQSVALGPQKWLAVPRLCALVLFPGLADFDARLGKPLPYSAGGQRHRGTWGLQGSRRADAVTLWTLLQILGRDAMATMIDESIDLARAFHERLRDHPQATALHAPDLNLQAFRFGPADQDGQRSLALQARLQAEGKAWVSVSRWRGEHVFRTVLLNPATTMTHLDSLLESLGRP